MLCYVLFFSVHLSFIPLPILPLCAMSIKNYNMTITLSAETKQGSAQEVARSREKLLGNDKRITEGDGQHGLRKKEDQRRQELNEIH